MCKNPNHAIYDATAGLERDLPPTPIHSLPRRTYALIQWPLATLRSSRHPFPAHKFLPYQHTVTPPAHRIEYGWNHDYARRPCTHACPCCGRPCPKSDGTGQTAVHIAVRFLAARDHHHAQRTHPAIMPQRRATDGPTTFASLDAQELPVVREYSAGVSYSTTRAVWRSSHATRVADIWNGACRKVISKKAKHRSKPPFAKFTRKQES